MTPAYKRVPSKIKTGDQPRPWLLICYGYDKQKLVLYNIEEKCYHKIASPYDMHQKMVHPTNLAEWLVIKDMNSPECCLLNITTFDTIKLPYLIEDEGNATQFVLDRSPYDAEHDCQIMVLNEVTGKAWLCKLGEDAHFRAIDVNTDGVPLRSATMFQGSFLLMTVTGILFQVKLDSVSRSPRCTQLMSKGIEEFIFRNSSFKVHLIADDELFLIHRLRTGTLKDTDRMLVFAMNFSRGEREWLRVKDIGDKAFFMSESASALCWSPTIPGLKGNSIYYVLPCDTNLYMYDLEDECTSSWDICSIMARYNSISYWISY